ncbi:MAG: SIS domain-containing protein [Anaerolineae bacterium]|jgi:glucosamine--fructose-6-phosphate aminotransferase (isomerizing)
MQKIRRLLNEIDEQPDVLQRLIAAKQSVMDDIVREFHERDVHMVLIAARGTSDNVAIYAKYLLGAQNGLPVALAAPSLYTLYDAPPRLKNTLVLGISQSGRSPDIVSVIQNARRQGMLTVAITNTPDSPLGDAAAHIIDCRAGEEQCVAATKSYTAQLMTIALLSVALSGDTTRRAQLETIPDAVAATLKLGETIAYCAERYRYMSDCAVLARGCNYATAFEVALKIKEMTYSRANAYSSADFMHGPIAVVDEGFPVIVVAPDGRTCSDMLNISRELHRREAEIIAISDRQEILDLATTPLKLPVSVPEWLSPITAVVPGQLFAYYLALARGVDPERPRGLRKVTETH